VGEDRAADGRLVKRVRKRGKHLKRRERRPRPAMMLHMMAVIAVGLKIVITT